MNAEIEAGYVLLIVSSIAWIAWAVSFLFQKKKLDYEQWMDWPARHRDVRENVKVPQ